jgi:hypothetical protein
MDGRTDMGKLMVVPRKFVNALNNYKISDNDDDDNRPRPLVAVLRTMQH